MCYDGHMPEGLRVDRLEALMKARGYGPGELAYQADVSYDYIYKIRKGGAPNIAAVQVQKLAAALKTSVEYLLGVTDDPRPIPPVEGQPYEVIMPPWPARVTELAARLGGAPDGALEQLLDVFEGILELMGLDGAGAPAATDAAEEYEDDEEARRLIWLLDRLPEERRLYWQAVIAAEAEALDQTDPGAAQTG